MKNLNLPVGIAQPLDAIPTATPAEGIPELDGREPTHNERVMIAGEPVYLGSTNVSHIWYHWQERRFFVSFLDGSLYAYEGVPLSVAVGMVETDSPGRYVWNKLRDVYAYRRLVKGTSKSSPQVIRGYQ